MTQEEFDKAPLLEQILYDETGMLVENHPGIAEAMEKYHQAKLKLLGIGAVMHWVAVTERLPNHGEKVLTYTPDSDDSFQLQRVITFGAIPSGFPSGVTHWMHLPEPPCP